MFHVNYNTASNANANIGCRHLVKRALLPDLTMFFHARMDWHPLVKTSKQDTP